MSKHMQVVNPSALTDALRQLETVASESSMRRATVAGARVVRKEILQRAPLGTEPHMRSGKLYPAGTLRKSIFIVFDEEDSLTAVRASYLVGIGRDAFYWQMLEWGTSRIPARPFFHPGYETAKARAADVITKVLEGTVAKALQGKK